jgi:hypothetical protein
VSTREGCIGIVHLREGGGVAVVGLCEGSCWHLAMLHGHGVSCREFKCAVLPLARELCANLGRGLLHGIRMPEKGEGTESSGGWVKSDDTPNRDMVTTVTPKKPRRAQNHSTQRTPAQRLSSAYERGPIRTPEEHGVCPSPRHKRARGYVSD